MSYSSDHVNSARGKKNIRKVPGAHKVSLMLLLGSYKVAGLLVFTILYGA